ncbi:MAG: hypothetical protein ABWZ82_03765 [Candidatus Limnocylindrales bacterium]
MRSSSILALAISLAATLVSPVAAQSPSVSPPADASSLREAASYLPPGAGDLAFTDWARIRASLGKEDVTGASTLDDKSEVVMSTVRGEAAASGFGVAYLRRHRDTWGWDTLDVDWEATFSVDGPPVHVVRLRDGVDTDAISARYDELGFATEQVGDAVVRTQPLDLASEWIGTTELAVVNTAFLDDGRTLLLSSGREGLDHVLSGTRAAASPPLDGVLDVLDGASAAWIATAPDCLAFTPLPFDPFDPGASIGPLPSGEPLHPWAAMGIGYQRPDWEPAGRIAMGFLDEAHAHADLEPRSAMARDGISPRAQRPFSEAVFTLDGARVEDTTLVLEVSPADDIATRLFQMVYARDMPFAGC